ncbi:MAG: hypothetical protein Q8N76_06365 [Candidatus Omnitrophota bacterium]|nr:hypothetical protein [Candidatus Omnitrophota bacterium]
MNEQVRIILGGISLGFERHSWSQHIDRVKGQYIFKGQDSSAEEDSKLISIEHADNYAYPIIRSKHESESGCVFHKRDGIKDWYAIYNERVRIFGFSYEHVLRCGTAYIQPSCPDVFFNRSFDAFVYGVVLAAHGGMIFHGASLVSPEGRGVILCGQSGAGKTTLANKLEADGYKIINDENAVVMQDKDGRYYLFPVPWSPADIYERYVHGVFLSVVFMLEHGYGIMSEYQDLDFRLRIMRLTENIRYFQVLTKAHSQLMRSVISLASCLPVGIVRHVLDDKSVFDLIEKSERRSYAAK